MKKETIIALIMTFFFIITLSSLIKTCNRANQNEDKWKETIALKEQLQKKYIDDSGRLHSTIIQQEANLEVVKAVYKNEFDSLKRVLKVKDNQIKEFIKIGINANNSGTGKIIRDTILKIDTLPGKIDTIDYSLEINDGYLKANLNVFKSLNYKWKYNYTDTLNYAVIKRKTGFLNLKQEVLIDISMSNKNSTISGIKQFKISDEIKQKKFSIGPFIGLTYDGSFKPNFGIGLQYNILKF